MNADINSHVVAYPGIANKAQSQCYEPFYCGALIGRFAPTIWWQLPLDGEWRVGAELVWANYGLHKNRRAIAVGFTSKRREMSVRIKSCKFGENEMGILLYSIDIWARTVDRMKITEASKVLTLGKQAVYFTYEDLTAMLRRNRYDYVDLEISDRKFVPAETLSSIHQGENFIDDETLFRVLGFRRENISRMDVSDFEGADVIFDLNDEYNGPAFDFVFDQGTGEHIFSQKDYFRNITRILKIGGMYHGHLPSNDIGHGFYCYGKDSLRDFFVANGFEEKYLRYIYMGNYIDAFWDYCIEASVDAETVAQSPLYGVGIAGVFCKIADPDFVVPNQTTYVQMWERHAEGKTTWTPGRATILREIKRYVAKNFPVIGAALIAAMNTRRILREGKRLSMTNIR